MLILLILSYKQQFTQNNTHKQNLQAMLPFLSYKEYKTQHNIQN